MNKETSVAFITKELKSSFVELKKGKFESKQLYKFIDRAIDDLKQNPVCGIKVSKKLWPKTYIQKYEITNLYKYDLPNGWRLLYTIEADEITIMGIIIEWMNHKEYERKFKY